jgi:hypothetical protein
MFKDKIILINENWETLHSYKSKFKPFVDEFIFIEEHGKYYKVLIVIHTRNIFNKNITVVVKEWEFFKKK